MNFKEFAHTDMLSKDAIKRFNTPSFNPFSLRYDDFFWIYLSKIYGLDYGHEQLLKKKYFRLKQVFSKFPILIYRGLYLPDLKLLDKKKLGIYWTFDPTKAAAYQDTNEYSHSLITPDRADMKGKNVYVLKANVMPEHIAWFSTIEANYSVPQECEVNLKSTARPKLLGIYPVQKRLPKYESADLTEDYHDHDKDIPFKKRLGRCYELAGRFAMNNEDTALVHGSIEGFGNPRIGHAWVELANGKIWEPATGKTWDGDAFAAFFNPKLGEYYDHEQLCKELLRNKNWGPWE